MRYTVYSFLIEGKASLRFTVVGCLHKSHTSRRQLWDIWLVVLSFHFEKKFICLYKTNYQPHRFHHPWRKGYFRECNKKKSGKRVLENPLAQLKAGGCRFGGYKRVNLLHLHAVGISNYASFNKILWLPLIRGPSYYRGSMLSGGCLFYSRHPLRVEEEP